MAKLGGTVSQRLENHARQLTRSERQLCDVILQNYPVSGLGTITTLAETAEVSTPTVARLIQKLGYKGFPEFQQALRSELDEKISSPLTKRENWVDQAPDQHLLNRFTKAVIENIGQSLSRIDTVEFEQACDLLSSSDKRVFVVGGRITRALADYFYLHLQIVRENVIHIASTSHAWPHHLLDFRPGDVVVVFDIRRYESSTLKLSELASQRGANIILFTDQWVSPVAEYSTVQFTNHITVPSAWDSNISLMLIVEIVVAEVVERNWDQSKARLEALEDIFDNTKLFRKF